MDVLVQYQYQYNVLKQNHELKQEALSIPWSKTTQTNKIIYHEITTSTNSTCEWTSQREEERSTICSNNPHMWPQDMGR
jgi:hypothetical protein